MSDLIDLSDVESPVEPGPSRTPRAWSKIWPWLLILGVVGLHLILQVSQMSQVAGRDGAKAEAGASESPEPPEPPGGLSVFRLQSKLIIGMGELAGGVGGTEQSAPLEPLEGDGTNAAQPVPGRLTVDMMEKQQEQALQQLSDLVNSPKSAEAIASVYAYVENNDAANKLLAKYPSTNASRKVIEQALAASEPPSEADQEIIEKRLGWFAELIRLRTLPAGHEDRVALAASARSAMVGYMLMIFGGILLLAIGLVFLIMGLIRAGRNEMELRFRRPSDWGGVKALQGFAVYMSAMLLLPLGLGLLPAAVVGFGDPMVLGVAGIVLAAVAGIVWARWRGTDRATFCRDWGWHRGEGIWKEVGCGLIGYAACIPIFVLGVILSYIVQQVWVGGGGAPIHHPVMDELENGGTGTFAFMLILAAVVAPITEELLFRGAFYGALRQRWRVLGSAAMVAFIFAAVHPQGVAGIPALMSLAIGFALLREWRGSLIAPIVAHAVHNGALVSFMFFAFQ